jgi:hypothetical protein
MTDSVSIESSAQALTKFALDSAMSLYETIASFKSKEPGPEQLSVELEPLNEALYRLKEENCMDEEDFNDLRLPLLRCGKACKQFEDVILGHSSRSGKPKICFQGWEGLQYMKNDIIGFKCMMGRYKNTIGIAVQLSMM